MSWRIFCSYSQETLVNPFFNRSFWSLMITNGSTLVLLDKVDDQVAELLWLFQVHQMTHAG